MVRCSKSGDSYESEWCVIDAANQSVSFLGNSSMGEGPIPEGV